MTHTDQYRTFKKIMKLSNIFYSFMVFAMALSGCATVPQSSPPVPLEWNVPDGLGFAIEPIGKASINLGTKDLNAIVRGKWSRASISIFNQSGLPSNVKYRALIIRGFQALYDSCKNIELLSIRVLPYDGVLASPAFGTLKPSEVWSIDACGTREELRVDDELKATPE